MRRMSRAFSLALSRFCERVSPEQATIPDRVRPSPGPPSDLGLVDDLPTAWNALASRRVRAEGDQKVPFRNRHLQAGRRTRDPERRFLDKLIVDAESIARILRLPIFSDVDATDFPGSLPLEGVIANDGRLQRYQRGDVIVRKDDARFELKMKKK